MGLKHDDIAFAGLNEADSAGGSMVTPIMAVGTTSGTIYLISVASLQVITQMISLMLNQKEHTLGAASSLSDVTRVSSR